MRCGRCVGSAAVLLQHRVEHLRDGALLGDGESADLFELELNLRRGPAFAGAALGARADQIFHGGLQRLGQLRERLDRDAGDAALVVRHCLLGDAEFFGQGL